MADSDNKSKDKEDELAGTEQPFVAHLMELRDRLLYCVYG
ncbi:Sec-independent protein translocase subunit TatC, partial [Mycobacterium tuberculosis]